MSVDYAEHCIREALKASKGNQAQARQDIVRQSMQDARLLLALTRPHLSGIVAYNIERVASGRADKSGAGNKASSQKTSQKQKKSSSKEESFGLEILKAVAGSPQIFGLEDMSATQKRGRTSQSHIDAIRAIADKKT